MSMDIEVYDSPTRYIIDSETCKDTQYVICLKTWSCTCADHVCRIYPQYRRGEITQKQAICKHMQKLIMQLGFGTAEVLVENEINQERAAKANPVRINQADQDCPF